MKFLLQIFEKTRTLFLIYIGHDVSGKVDDLFNLCGRKAKNKRYARWNTAKKPDVCNGGSKVNVPHAFAADNCTRNFHTAFLTDNAAETDAAVLAAVTLIIFFRTKYALVKETILLRTLCAVVDSLGFCYFAPAPLEGTLRAREPHCDRLKVLWNYIFFALHVRDSYEFNEL